MNLQTLYVFLTLELKDKPINYTTTSFIYENNLELIIVFRANKIAFPTHNVQLVPQRISMCLPFFDLIAVLFGETLWMISFIIRLILFSFYTCSSWVTLYYFEQGKDKHLVTKRDVLHLLNKNPPQVLLKRNLRKTNISELLKLADQIQT